MSGALRRGSLNFDCNLKNSKSRGGIDTNLYGGYHDPKPRTPEFNVIALDFRRYSEDLKKNDLKSLENKCVAQTERDLSQDEDSDVISNFIGHHGRWQLIWTFLLTLLQIPPTFHLFIYAFQSAAKDYWCARPDNAPDMDVSLWRNLSQPDGACTILNLNYTQLPNLASTPEVAQLIPCTHFEFSSDDGSARTLIEEFSLVCDNARFVSVVEMCFLAGAAMGSVSSGWISDRFGRKHTLMIFVLVQIITGTLLAYSANLAMFMSLRAVAGFASMTVNVVSFVLVVELVSGKWRTITGILCILPVPLSYILMAGIAYFVRDWRILQLLISLPWIAALSIWYCMPESPRWLLAQGRLNELYSLIERAATINKRILPPTYKLTLEAAASTPNNVPKDAQQQQITAENGVNNIGTIIPHALEAAIPTAHDNPLKVVFNRFYWHTTCLNLIAFLTLVIVYYGLTLHLSNLGGDIYLNTIVSGAIEAISVCVSIFVVLKVGLRRSIIMYMIIPGIICFAPNLLPTRDDNETSVVIMAIIAKCVIGANNAILPSYIAMQYPTVVRNFGLGIGSLASGIGLIIVPYMWLLESVDPLLPMSIMGICGIVGAFGVFLMKNIEH